MNAADFTVQVSFEDGIVRLGGNDELFVEPGDDERLHLIALLQKASGEALA